jgi:hypothetical protein
MVWALYTMKHGLSSPFHAQKKYKKPGKIISFRNKIIKTYPKLSKINQNQKVWFVMVIGVMVCILLYTRLENGQVWGKIFRGS